MNLPALHTALRAHARGLYHAEAGVELLISHGSFLRRNDFHDRFIHHGISITDTTTMATVDWPATLTAIDAGDLPCSNGEQRIIRIAASISDGIPVDLRDCLTGLDRLNIQLVISAVLHASGQRTLTEIP